jgi:hypothetical protein
MTEKKISLADLAHFTGAETVYRHSLNRKVLYTEGVQYLAEHAGAYWLIDEIAIAQGYEPRVKAEEFQSWKLVVTNSTATLTCDDGNGNVVFSKHIEFTDFPLPEINLWVEGNVILLPSEH